MEGLLLPRQVQCGDGRSVSFNIWLAYQRLTSQPVALLRPEPETQASVQGVHLGSHLREQGLRQ